MKTDQVVDETYFNESDTSQGLAIYERPSRRSLKIGYLMQNGAPDLSVASGPQLHVSAVINGFCKLGHHIRTVATQNNEIGWSDDLHSWHPPRFGVTKKRAFRFAESLIRRVQTELQIPFIGLFDSLHFADACCNTLSGYDILFERHGYMGYGGVIAARLLGIPLIVEINGNIVREIDQRGLNMSALQRDLGRRITRWTWLTADHLVIVSKSLKQHLVAEQGVPEKRASVVLNGVNIELFTRCFDKKQVRDLFGITPGAIVTFVGSFEPWHGVDLLVSSFAQVLSEFPDAQLLLIGVGEGLQAVAAEIDRMGLQKKVRLLGRLPQEQVAAVLSITDVVVAPYPFDRIDTIGTPLKVLEYMAAGKAIVVSTAPIHEIIVDGVTGIRVKPADKAALARGIAQLLRDEELSARLGANARHQAQRLGSWDCTVSQLEALMFHLLGSQREDGGQVG